MTQHRFTISGNSRAELRAAFDELFGDGPGNTTAVKNEEPAKASGRGSRKGAAAAPDPVQVPEAQAQPDPFAPSAATAAQATAAAADPFAPSAPQPPGDDPFAPSAPQPPGDDPFAPSTAPTTAAAPLAAANPAVEKLIERFEAKSKEPNIGPDRVRDYLAKLLGLAPSVPLAEMYSKLRAGAYTPDVVDKLLDQTGGR